MEEILNAYYSDNATKLRRLVDRIVLKIGGTPCEDREDFYSLANEVFADALRRYDGTQSFDGFLYTCLSNRIKTELTKKNCQKRKADKTAVSLDMPVGEEGDLTLADVIAGDFDVERAVFGEENVNSRMEAYLDRLSRRQREIVGLLADSYKAGEIRKRLHLTQREYTDAMFGIRLYENVSILRQGAVAGR